MKKPQKHKKSASSTIHPYIHTPIHTKVSTCHQRYKRVQVPPYTKEKKLLSKERYEKRGRVWILLSLRCNQSFASPCVSATSSTFTYTFPLTFGCTNPAYPVCVFHIFFRVYSDLHIDIWIFGPHPLLTTYLILDLSFGFPQHSPNTIFASFCVWFCVCSRYTWSCFRFGGLPQYYLSLVRVRGSLLPLTYTT